MVCNKQFELNMTYAKICLAQENIDPIFEDFLVEIKTCVSDSFE